MVEDVVVAALVDVVAVAWLNKNIKHMYCITKNRQHGIWRICASPISANVRLVAGM